jgi:hypothetical protein
MQSNRTHEITQRLTNTAIVIHDENNPVNHIHGLYPDLAGRAKEIRGPVDESKRTQGAGRHATAM